MSLNWTDIRFVTWARTIFMTTFSACLTKKNEFFLPQSHDCSCCVCRRILVPPTLRLQIHTVLRAHGFALSLVVTSALAR